MGAREQKLAQQIEDALCDNRFQPGFFPSAIQEISFDGQRQLFNLITIQLDRWAMNYNYNQFFAMPQDVGEAADRFMRGYRELGGVEEL